MWGGDSRGLIHRLGSVCFCTFSSILSVCVYLPQAHRTAYAHRAHTYAYAHYHAQPNSHRITHALLRLLALSYSVFFLHTLSLSHSHFSIAIFFPLVSVFASLSCAPARPLSVCLALSHLCIRRHVSNVQQMACTHVYTHVASCHSLYDRIQHIEYEIHA